MLESDAYHTTASGSAIIVSTSPAKAASTPTPLPPQLIQELTPSINMAAHSAKLVDKTIQRVGTPFVNGNSTTPVRRGYDGKTGRPRLSSAIRRPVCCDFC